MLICFAFVACEKDNTTTNSNNRDTGITDDDIGIEVNISNDGQERIFFPQFYLTISSSNNFCFGNTCCDISIARFGSVSGISAITSIPSSGWVGKIAVNPGTGYVIRYGDYGYTYIRLYVKNWIVSTSGGIIGATVVYQDNWRPDKMEATN